jgi:hypothetical protein
MITKDVLKTEIDNVQNEHLEILYRVIKAFEIPVRSKGSNKTSRKKNKRNDQSDWNEFIRETYGCLADDPIERGNQGTFEIREALE